MTVELEKCECSEKPRSLVSIDERMIQNEREVKASRHLKDVVMEELTTELCHGLRYGGFQEIAVPQSLRPAVLGYLRCMNFQDIVDVKEFGVQSARSFNAF
jgi:hypothetical protein